MKDSKAAHNDTEAVDLDSCIEVVAKKEECTNSILVINEITSYG